MTDITPATIAANSAPALQSVKASDDGVEHVEHVEQAVNPSSADEKTKAMKYDSQSKDIETVAYVVEEVNAPFKLAPIILDEIRPDEVLVEMKYSGVCKPPSLPQTSPQTSSHLSS